MPISEYQFRVSLWKTEDGHTNWLYGRGRSRGSLLGLFRPPFLHEASSMYQTLTELADELRQQNSGWLMLVLPPLARKATPKNFRARIPVYNLRAPPLTLFKFLDPPLMRTAYMVNYRAMKVCLSSHHSIFVSISRLLKQSMDPMQISWRMKA